jgi:hypothetical protein
VNEVRNIRITLLFDDYETNPISSALQNNPTCVTSFDLIFCENAWIIFAFRFPLESTSPKITGNIYKKKHVKYNVIIIKTKVLLPQAYVTLAGLAILFILEKQNGKRVCVKDE